MRQNMEIPSKEIIINRLAEDYLLQGCDYFPCHKDLETCNLCFCIFYPCEDTDLGEYKISRKGTKVWSCMKCGWIHMKETLERLRVFLIDEENHKSAPGDMYIKFIKIMEVEG